MKNLKFKKNPKSRFNQVDQPVEKVDGLALCTGSERYVADFAPRDVLHVKMLWSPHAHAIIKKIDKTAAERMPGVRAVLTWKDVPRVIHTTAGQGYPEPSPYDTYTLDKKVRFVGDRVAAVCADTPEQAAAAVKKIKVEYKVLKAVFDPREAISGTAPVIHDEPEAHYVLPIKLDKKRNLVAQVNAAIGDVEKGLQESDYVVEGEYVTNYAQHCPIEPHVSMAHIDERGRIVIRTSTQVPFHCRRIIAARLQLPEKMIRVIKPRVGGAFGTKQEVILEDIVALLAYRLRKPVLWEYTRSEELISGRTRHPMVIKVRAGAKKNGKIHAIDMDCVLNSGAYGTQALTVGCNAGSKILPLFNKAKHIRFKLDCAYTNLPVGGAYRGYGATQGYFPMGQAIDELTRKMGVDICEFYKKNHIKVGEGSPVFQMLGEGREGTEFKISSCGLSECIDRGAKEIGWKKKRGKRIRNGSRVRGVGMVALMQGSSIPHIDMAASSLKMNEDGSFNLLLGATDLGTGSDTVISQIVAETLGVETNDILPYSSDTDMTPFDVGAYASSTTYLSGGAALKAALKVKEQIIAVARKMLGVPARDEIVLEKKHAVHTKSGKKVSFKEIALHSLYVEEQHQIAAHASKYSEKSPPPFSAHFAEVEVDEETGYVKVLKYVAAIDCGTPIHPLLAEGQMEGAVLNGISYALTEEYIFSKKGKMLNPGFGNYKIWSTSDIPEMKTILVRTYEDSGPYGAKSVSEIGINGPAPAIANAIYDAVGVRLYEIPMTPEKVLGAIRAQRKGKNPNR